MKNNNINRNIKNNSIDKAKFVELNSALNSIKKNGGDLVLYFVEERISLKRIDIDTSNLATYKKISTRRSAIRPEFFNGKSMREVGEDLDSIKSDACADYYKLVKNN